MGRVHAHTWHNFSYLHQLVKMENKTSEVHIPHMNVYNVYIDIERGDQNEQRQQNEQSDQNEQGDRHVCCSRQSIAVLTFLVIIGVLMLLLIFFSIIPDGHSISFRLIIFISSIFLFLGFFLWITLVSLISENCVF